MKVFLIAGARPNFMKVAPLFREAVKYSEVACKLVHTGQHYDYEMSQAFFEDLEISPPHFFLNAGSGTHATQTAKIMTGFEQICLQEKPELILVVGDVNSTLACSIAAKKLAIKVGHVEAGLRSFDLTMPEEINRIVTDSISDYFFVTEHSAISNLVNEGKPRERIFHVGNVMVDNLLHQLSNLENGTIGKFSTSVLKEQLGEYIFLTMHRPSNVDSKEIFTQIADALNEIAESKPILFPVHPRTQKMMDIHGIQLSPRVHLLPPLSFKESLFLWKDAVMVMTDSGGLQEETTALSLPCVTLRENTERPITIEMGTNVLGGTRKETILKAYEDRLGSRNGSRGVPPKWDGRAAQRIWATLLGVGAESM